MVLGKNYQILTNVKLLNCTCRIGFTFRLYNLIIGQGSIDRMRSDQGFKIYIFEEVNDINLCEIMLTYSCFVKIFYPSHIYIFSIFFNKFKKNLFCCYNILFITKEKRLKKTDFIIKYFFEKF